MKRTITILAMAGLVLAACDKKETPKAAAPPPPAQATQPIKPAFATSDSFQVGIGKVYSGYLQIEGALAHDDFAKAKEAFDGMHMVLHTLPMLGLDTAAKAEWDSLDGRLMKVLHPMASSPDIAVMRDHLADFTPLMLEAIENFGIQGGDPVYRFHCPMARNNAGADWLQRDKTKENPFYGKAMSQCGSLVQSVKI